MNKRFIVAELSKTWANVEYDDGKKVLNSQFEHVINVNSDRGYKLLEWKLSKLMYTWTDPDGFETMYVQETIIAVFELSNKP